MQPSNYEANRYLGDIVEEIDKALMFVQGMAQDDFINDSKSVYSVEKAIQNAIEACIQLNDNKANKGQFNRIFPKFDFERLRRIANSGRHDYGNNDTRLLWNELHGVLTDLRNAAEKALMAKRTK